MNDAMLFGKLPAHGDFVARGLREGERAWWDETLSLALARAMDAYGATFAERYRAAPAWCFRIDRGDGDGDVTGALAPSADRVGRAFPVMLARHGDSGAAACAALLMAVRDAGWSVDMLTDRLHDTAGDTAPLPHGWWPSGAPASPEAILAVDTPAAVLVAMLAEVAA